MSEIQLYKALRAKLGDVEAQELVSFIKSEINSEFMNCKDIFLVKADKVELIQAMKEDKDELMRAIKESKHEIMQECRRTFLTKDDKIDLLRSMYMIGLVQFLAIVGTILAILSFYFKR